MPHRCFRLLAFTAICSFFSTLAFASLDWEEQRSGFSACVRRNCDQYRPRPSDERRCTLACADRFNIALDYDFMPIPPSMFSPAAEGGQFGDKYHYECGHPQDEINPRFGAYLHTSEYGEVYWMIEDLEDGWTYEMREENYFGDTCSELSSEEFPRAFACLGHGPNNFLMLRLEIRELEDIGLTKEGDLRSTFPCKLIKAHPF